MDIQESYEKLKTLFPLVLPEPPMVINNEVTMIYTLLDNHYEVDLEVTYLTSYIECVASIHYRDNRDVKVSSDRVEGDFETAINEIYNLVNNERIN